MSIKRCAISSCSLFESIDAGHLSIREEIAAGNQRPMRGVNYRAALHDEILKIFGQHQLLDERPVTAQPNQAPVVGCARLEVIGSDHAEANTTLHSSVKWWRSCMGRVKQ